MFVFCQSGQSVRIITSFDIARWYLDSDLVLICNIKQTNTVTISKHDSLGTDGFRVLYDILREKYQLSIDSIIKGGEFINGTMDTIFTPVFSTTPMRIKTEFTGLDSKGDSVFIAYIEINETCSDDSYFRIKSQEKHLVILRKTEIGYVIDYETECNDITLNLIKEVKLKGEDYFSSFFLPAVDTLPVYDHHCESGNPYEIDTTLFNYQNDTLYIRNVKNEFCCPRKLLALVKTENDTLIVNIVNPVVADCTCECSYGYTVKIKMAPFDALNLRINNEKFTVLKSDFNSSTKLFKDKDLLIYPNPFSELLHIDGIQAKRIEITDINGKTYWIKTQDPQCIDLSSLKPGPYIISIYTDNNKWTEKIIKE